MTYPEAIILAGGFGTRLASAVPDLPKCMAPVAGKPFIDHLISYLLHAGINRIVFALGYKSEVVIHHLHHRWKNLDFDYTVEHKPLGTGGAISLSSAKMNGPDFLVFNGDTFFEIDLGHFIQTHRTRGAFISVSLKRMKEFDRYGTVKLDSSNRIIQFQEKSFCHEGLINGGVYMIDKRLLNQFILPEEYSFEKDLLEVQVAEGKIYGQAYDGYFIDIGIPEDFSKANKDFRHMMMDNIRVAGQVKKT